MDNQITLPDGAALPFAAARKVVSAYLDRNAAAVALYDRTNVGPHNTILPIDLLSLAALNAFGRVGPMTAIAEVWPFLGEIGKRVEPITTLDFFELPGRELVQQVTRVCDALEVPWKAGARYWGRGTLPAKLLHRLRPNIIPIWDSFVGTWYGGKNQPWKEFVEKVHADVMQPATLSSLRQIRAEIGCNLPILRIWDILLWKSRSMESQIG